METMVDATPERSGRDLIDATRDYAVERRAASWWYVASTFAVMAAAAALAAAAPWWPARLAAAVVEGLVIVRAFILYHDFMHGAILRGSPAATALFKLYGLLVLTPPTVWKQTHNYHHAHTAKIVGSHVGSYMMLTTEMWKKISARERLGYKVTRHPLTILFGYVTIFAYGMCVSPFRRDPKKNWDSLAALALHLAILAAVAALAGPLTALLAVVLPMCVAHAMGAYLFYAQHNFPDIAIQPRETWSYTTAALESSSYLACGPVMAWFTGNIGYHHVHHLNPTIPFYRLPEAMRAIPELRNPHTTTLRPRDVLACFRLKLWDAEAGRMVGYPEGT